MGDRERKQKRKRERQGGGREGGRTRGEVHRPHRLSKTDFNPAITHTHTPISERKNERRSDRQRERERERERYMKTER